MMHTNAAYDSSETRKPLAVAAYILNEAEKQGYPVNTFRSKEPDLASSGCYPAYAEIIKDTEAILNFQEKLNRIRGEIASYNLCNPYMATHPALIEKKVQKLVDELQRVRAIIEFQAQIQSNLENCVKESSLPIRIKYHKAVVELLHTMPKMIKNMKENIDNMDWFLKFQPNRNIERISSSVTHTFSQLQYTVKQIGEFHAILKTLHEIRCETTKKLPDEEGLGSDEPNNGQNR